MKYLVVGNGDSRATLVAIANDLRSYRRTVDCYFGEHIELLKTLPEADALVVGLSAESRDPASKAFKNERDLIRRAAEERMFIGIVCDRHGTISAPYLVELGSEISVVVVHESNCGCGPNELCQYAYPIFAPDPRLCAAKLDSAFAGMSNQRLLRMRA